jgi:hypothetical protein
MESSKESCTKYLKYLTTGIAFVGSFQCNLLYLANYPEGSREHVRIFINCLTGIF